MPDLNGMDFVKSLVVPPLVVFTTAYSEYAVEGFRVNAVDYLLKPFGLQDFQRAANRLRERYKILFTVDSLQFTDDYSAAEGRAESGLGSNHSAESGLASKSTVNRELSTVNNNTLFLKTDYRIVKVNIPDIRYVEGMSEYLKVWIEGEAKPIITLLSMKKIEERLPASFMRIHRSYIINLDKIQEVNKNRVIMDADTYLPIGDLYKDAFQAYLDTKFLGR